MRKLTLFILSALIFLPLNLHADENYVLDLGTHGIGEVVTIPEFNGLTFHVAPNAADPKSQSANDFGDWAAYTRLWYTEKSMIYGSYYGYEGWFVQLRIDEIWCTNSGTDHIYLTQYEFDEDNNVTNTINWDVTITVAGGIVEIGACGPGCENSDPDPTVLKDTTIHYGEEYWLREGNSSTLTQGYIENYVGFRYIAYNSVNDGVWNKYWSCVSSSEMTVTSSDPDVVVIEWDEYTYRHKIIGQKRGTATITVSTPATSEHLAKSVQYNVKVTGDAGPNIGFYQYYSLLEDLVLEGANATTLSTNYPWPKILEDGYSEYNGDFTVTSSNTDVATIDNPTSNEVRFTFVGYGTTTITVTVLGDDYTEDAVASFTLTYVDPNAVDMYFTDGDGNRIDHIDVGTNEYGEPVYPFTEIRLFIEQQGTSMAGWATVNVEPEDIDVVNVWETDSYYDYKAYSFSCMNLGSTDIVATFEGDNCDENYCQYSPATARLTINYVNTYRIPTTISITGNNLQDGVFNITDTDCGSLGVSYSLPTTWVNASSDLSTNLNLPLTVTSSDESVVVIDSVRYSSEYTLYYIYFGERDYGHATITVAFAGDEMYAASDASFELYINMNFSPLAEMKAHDAEDNIVTDLVLTEGDMFAIDLVREDGETDCYSGLNRATTTDKSCWKPNRTTHKMDFYPHAAGLDTIVYERWRYSGFDDFEDMDDTHRHYWPYRETIKVPVVIMPYLTPVADDAETQMNLNPESNTSISFATTESGDSYNSTEGQLEISSVVTAANLQLALDSMATGKKEWNDLLPGATTFNVKAGSGKIKIQCQTVEGYELKVLIRNGGTATITQPTIGVAEVNYNVSEVSAVLIYLWPTSGSNPAPARRAPKAKNEDTPNAIIKSIQVVPDGIQEVPTGVETINNNLLPVTNKVLENGVLYIIHDGVRYNAQGQAVK